MADTKYVVSNVLCYIANRYGKSDSKSLRDIVSDFYDSEELSRAKIQLSEDIQSVIPSSLSLPHLPTRRDGDTKAVRTVDDILTMITFADENLLMSALPRYVADSPDRLPSARLYEGDMALLVGLVKRLEGRVDQVDGQLAAILKAVHDVGLQVCKPSTGSLQASAWPALSINTASVKAAVQADRSRVAANTSAVGGGQSTSTSTIAGVRSADRSAEQTSSAAGLGTDWASLAAASSVNVSNRYAALQTTDDEQADDSQYELSRSARRRANKRQRQHSQQSQQTQQQQSSTVAVAATPVASYTSSTTGNQKQKRNNPVNQFSVKRKPQPMLIGKKQFSAGDRSSQYGPRNIMAAKPYVGKAVFCIDNVITSATESDIECHIKRMDITVLSCHAVQPRRSRWQRLRGIVPADRNTFRVCIPREQSGKLLVADAWPASITITPWRFTEKKDTTTAAESASSLLPSGERQLGESTSGGSHGTSTTTDRFMDHRRAVAAAVAAAAGSDSVGDCNDNILSHAATASLMMSPSKMMSDVSERDFVSSLSNNDDVSENMDETIIVSYDGCEPTKSN